jgi:hypothetical protein
VSEELKDIKEPKEDIESDRDPYVKFDGGGGAATAGEEEVAASCSNIYIIFCVEGIGI